jgi:hypothetical protein
VCSKVVVPLLPLVITVVSVLVMLVGVVGTGVSKSSSLEQEDRRTPKIKMVKKMLLQA